MKPFDLLKASTLVLLSLCLVTVATTQPVASQSLEERVEKLEKKLETDDQAPTNKYVDEFGGRIMADFTFNADESQRLYSGSDEDVGLGEEAEDGFEFRRARLFVEGPIGKAIDYKLQLDFADDGEGSAEIRDAWIKYKGLPVVNGLKVGKFKEPFSINEQTSSKYITFMSRSALTDGLSQARQPGAMTGWSGMNDKINVAVGVFNPQEEDEDDGDVEDPGSNGSYDLAGRLTSPVLYEQNGRKLVHLGIGARQSAEQDGVDVGLEPEVHKGDPEFLEVSIPDGMTENSTTYGLEGATVFGPLSFQAEWAEQDVGTTGGASDVDLESWYAFGSFFLTGEHRPYDPGAGDFGRIDVRDEWHGVGSPGTGAWEVAARWSETDFTDAQGIGGPGGPASGRDIDQDGDFGDVRDRGALAGEMEVLTLGLNWYPHEHAKWMLNYVDAEQTTLDGDGQWVTTRFQVDF